MTEPLLLKLGGVSRVTGVREVTLIRWFDRMTIKPCDAATTGSGDHRRFSRATINQIAIAKKQIDLGVPPGPANAAAALFTEHGQPGRPANTLFEFGRTLLMTDASGSRIVNSQFDDALIDVCGRPFASALIVDIGQIIHTVDSALSSISKKGN